MLDIKEVINAIKPIWGYLSRNYYSIKGLLAQIFIVTCAVFPASKWVLDTLLPEAQKESYLTLTAREILLIDAVVWTLLNAVIVAYWLFKRMVPRFRGGKIGVLFAAETEPELKKELYDLAERLVGELKQKDLREQIIVRRLPPNHKVQCHTDAMRLLAKARGRVLISGRFERATYKGKQVTGFSQVSFSCNTLPYEAVHRAEVIADSFAGRAWGWDADNSVDRRVVAQNLAEVSRYVIGLSLLAQGRNDEAGAMLGILRLDINAKYLGRHVAVPTRRFQETIKRAYIMTLLNGVREAYQTQLDEEHIFDVPRSTLMEWTKRLQETIQLDENVPGSRLFLAIIAFLEGDTQQAMRWVRDECARFPTSRVACAFSEAFLKVFTGDFHEARKLYKRVTNDPTASQPRFIHPILSFVEQAAAKYANKPELIFLIGLLNHELYDRVRAHEAFEAFIREAHGRDDLTAWIREAKIHIETIRRDLEGLPPNQSAETGERAT